MKEKDFPGIRTPEVLSDAVSLIASEKTWIETEAIRQLHQVAALQSVSRVVGLPDLHPGIRYPVGMACFSSDRIYPALIGSDIGCGMAFWKLTLKASRGNVGRLDKKLGDLDGPPGELTELMENLPEWATEQPGLGTIGGGNHFAELQRLDAVYDAVLAEKLELDAPYLFLLIHSGSRNLGHSIYEKHVQGFSHDGVDQNDPACADYLDGHDRAVQFAKLNRELVARRILKRLNARGEKLLDVVHNAVTKEVFEGATGWVHRKGANSAYGDLSVIPGSRGDFTWLVQPLGSDQTLFSLPHGAGRKWARNDCRGRLERRFTQKELLTTALGSHVICSDGNLIYEEAAQAYKPLESVIAPMVSGGLLRLIARFRPVLTYKTRGRLP